MKDKTVVVGDGEIGNSWSVVLHTSGEISENSKSYFIHDMIIKYNDMFIIKNSKEGKFLTKLIKNQVNHSIVMLWCKKVYIRNAPFSIINNVIEEAEKRSFERGQKEKQHQILEALGVNYEY